MTLYLTLNEGLSEQTAKAWSQILLPHGTQCFRAACPFCAIPLDGENPYIRLIYQVFNFLSLYLSHIYAYRIRNFHTSRAYISPKYIDL